jgi:hypothetical protein
VFQDIWKKMDVGNALKCNLLKFKRNGYLCHEQSGKKKTFIFGWSGWWFLADSYYIAIFTNVNCFWYFDFWEPCKAESPSKLNLPLDNHCPHSNPYPRGCEINKSYPFYFGHGEGIYPTNLYLSIPIKINNMPFPLSLPLPSCFASRLLATLLYQLAASNRRCNVGDVSYWLANDACLSHTELCFFLFMLSYPLGKLGNTHCFWVWAIYAPMGMDNLGMDMGKPKPSPTEALLYTLTQLFRVALHLWSFREVGKGIWKPANLQLEL